MNSYLCPLCQQSRERSDCVNDIAAQQAVRLGHRPDPAPAEPRRPSAKWDALDVVSAKELGGSTLSLRSHALSAHVTWDDDEPDAWRWRADWYPYYGKNTGQADSLESAQLAAEQALRTLLTDALKEL